MDEFLQDLAEWTPLLLRGIWTTIFVTVTTMVLSIMLGLLVALAHIAAANSRRTWARIAHVVIRAYVDTLRGVPLVVTLFIIFFALPAAGLNISDSPLIAGIFGFTLNVSAYLSEVFRAAILSVDTGQMEAALSLGMSRAKAYRRIVLPQSLIVAVPTLGGYFISALKDSSLLGFVSVLDLMRTGILLVTTTFKAFEIYFLIGFLYLVMSLIASSLVIRVERRLTPVHRRRRAADELMRSGSREVALLEVPVPAEEQRP